MKRIVILISFVSLIVLLIPILVNSSEENTNLDKIQKNELISRSTDDFKKFEIETEKIDIAIKNRELLIFPEHLSGKYNSSVLNNWSTKLQEDFLVNDDTTGGGTWCLYSDIAVSTNGSFLVAWSDSDRGLFIQAYDSLGNSIGENVRVSHSVYSVAVAVNNQLEYVLIWHGANGQGLRGQRFDNNGNNISDSFEISDSDAFVLESSITMDYSGRFVVTWRDYRNGPYPDNPDIYAQIFDVDCTPIGGNFKINDDSTNSYQSSPEVAYDSKGSFVFVWSDGRNSSEPKYDTDIYAQRYRFDGLKIGSNFQVNSDTNYSQVNPVIKVSENGNLIILWERYRSPYGSQGVYFRIINGCGVPMDLDKEIDLRNGDSPDVAIIGNKGFVATWRILIYKEGDFHDEIWSRIYDFSGVPIGTSFKVDDESAINAYPPTVSSDLSGNFIVVWPNIYEPYNNSDIYCQKYDSNGNTIEQNQRVNDLGIGNTDQEAASIAVGMSGDFVVTWRDYRDGVSRIYAQMYNNNGSLIGDNFKVDSTTSDNSALSSSVAADGSGNYFITWLEKHDDTYSIYVKRYQFRNSNQGSQIKVNDDSILVHSYSTPEIAVNNSGQFVITWALEDDSESGGVYAQLFDFDGLIRIGKNIKVNDDLVSNIQHWKPSCAIDQEGKFAIIWTDHRSGELNVYLQRFDHLATPIGQNIQVNNGNTTRSLWGWDIAMNNKGDFVTVWTLASSSEFNIYAQCYDSVGEKVGDNFIISTIESESWFPSVSFYEQDAFVVSWDVLSNNSSSVYGKQLEFGGQSLSDCFIASDENYSLFWQGGCEVDGKYSQICFTWSDKRRNKGIDVYGSLLNLTPTNIEENKSDLLPDSYILSQNFPNPFNPSTTIEFTLPTKSEVSIEIYNVLGQRVRMLTERIYSAGNHKVYWDGNGTNEEPVASGVYLYKLRTDKYEQTKKMLLLK